MSYYDDLFEVASAIVKIKDELFCLTIRNVVDINSYEFQNKLEELKVLVSREIAILSKMSIEDVKLSFNQLRDLLRVNSTIEFYDKLNSWEDVEGYLTSEFKKSDFISSNLDAFLRVFYRLKNQAFMLTDGKIKLKVGNDEKVFCYVSKWDALKLAIDILILKSIEVKIDRLNPQNEDEEDYLRDKKIIKELRNNFKRYLFNVVFGSFDIEFRMIFSNFDLDKLKVIDINRLLGLGVFDKEELDAFILNEFKLLLDEFSIVICYDSVYNANNLFSMLRLVTAIEVLLPFVNTNMIDDDMYLDILCDKYGNVSGKAVNEYVRKRVKWVENSKNY